MSENTKTPYVIAIIMMLIHTGNYVFTKAAMNHGFNSFVFSFYRQLAASLLLVPTALVFQRCTSFINLLNVSLTLTSATVASATANAAPISTFCVALLFRMEVLKLRSCSGIAKLFGIGLCIAGVFIIAFYAGPALSPVNHHHAITQTSTPRSSPSRVAWIEGTFFMVLSCVAWSLWLIMQTSVLKEYPNKMLVTVTQCVFSTLQCFFVAIIAERDFSKWVLHLDISLLAIFYNGFMVSGVCYYLQVWFMKMKGPVYLAMWTPLILVFTIFCSSFFLGEMVHLGSIIGAILLVGGLYSVLWAKAKEPTINPSDHTQDERDQHNSIPQVDEETTSTSA